MRRIEALLLIAVPALYYFALVVGGLTDPNFHWMTSYASELGMAEAANPALFNICAMLCGASAVAAAALMPRTFASLGASKPWLVVAAIALALWGAGTVMAGYFPIPDERHGGFGLGMAGILVPLFLLIALRKAGDTARLWAFLAFVFVGTVVLNAIMFGVGELVRQSNVGAWQRVNSLFSIGWLLVPGFWLLRRRAPNR